MGGIGAGRGWSVGLGSQELPRPSPPGQLCPLPASPGLSQLLPAVAPLQALWACRGDAALQQMRPPAMAGILSVSPEDMPRAQGGAP